MHAVQTVQAPGALALVYLNTTMAFQIVSFLLLVAFLNKKLFRPMLAYLDKRAKTIKHELDQARETRAVAETDRKDAQQELDSARRESYEIRTQSREIARGERERILDDARGEAEHVVEKTKRDIAQSADIAREALRQRAGELAVQVAEKVLRTELSTEQKRKATTVYLDEAERL
jgi:F-type H+-transporting ATPase subunit b